MPTNRIFSYATESPADNGWVWLDGRWHVAGHTFKLDPPEVCTGNYLCECSRCENCEPPVIDFDQMLRDSDSLRPLNGGCDDECK